MGIFFGIKNWKNIHPWEDIHPWRAAFNKVFLDHLFLLLEHLVVVPGDGLKMRFEAGLLGLLGIFGLCHIVNLSV